MRNFIFALTVAFSCSTIILAQSQVQATSYQRIYDTLFDQTGNKYSLSDLNVSANRPFQSVSATNSFPVATCTAGYFVLYFSAGTIFTLTAAQNALCQVFTDVSNFVESPLATTGTKVRIFCGNTTAAGMALNLFLFPNGTPSPYPGVSGNQVYKTIVSGIDSYNNFPISVFNGSNYFYHGSIFANSSLNWNFAPTSTTIASNELDFYSIMLHEVTHLLGFETLIGNNGASIFSANYYTIYDKFLTNSNLVPLLTNTTSCGLTFTGSATQVNPNNCSTGTPSFPPDASTCSTAVKYVSNSQTVTVYTPNCFESGSSLCHFEDMCASIGGTNSCTGSPANWNNLYYAMSNANSTGPCYIKRYLKEEERQVLCDLGYTVNSTYSCNLSGAKIDGLNDYHNYVSGKCNGPGIWAQNDGIMNSVFTFTATSSSTNAIAISISNSIISNDSPNTSTINCLDVVYNNATCTVSSGSLIVTTAVGFSGLVVLKYCPETSGGAIGLPSYVFVYFLQPNCPPNSCDLVSNGGFENNTSAATCGSLVVNSTGTVVTPMLECWEPINTPDYFVRNCTLFSNAFNVGNQPVMPAYIFLDSFNGASNNNDAFVGMLGGTISGNSESLRGNLSSPLVPNQSYQASIWIYNSSAIGVPFLGLPFVFHIYSMPNFAFFGAPNTLGTFTVIPNNIWTQYVVNFVFAQTVNHSSIGLELHPVLTQSLNSSLNPTIAPNTYFYLDEFSIKPTPTPTFLIPNAQSCGNTTYTDLAQYASQVPGVFSGVGVTTINIGGVIQYNFNASTPGIYPIAFTYTSGSCAISLWQNISVAQIPTLSVTGATNLCSNLVNNSATLAVSCTSCSGSSFYWLPANTTSSNIVVTPTVSTIYTVINTGSICTSQQTIAVNVNTACCTQTNITAVSTPSTSLASTTLSSSAFNWDYTVSAGTWLTLLADEFLFASNTKLVVENGGVLWIRGSHLYSCNNEMWQGIEVKDGGQVRFVQYSGRDNLIEDAVAAISHVSQVGGSGSTVFELRNTTFNKNYVDILLTNYSPTVTSYPMTIQNCIFTCRALPFNSAQWPQTGSSSSATNVTADLRYVNTSLSPTTGLASPYLTQSGFSITTLKNPYSTQSSQVAIQLTTVGVNSGTTQYGISIGDGGSAANFNLFDAHKFGVFAINSNVSLQNNVFQNTTAGSMLHPDIGGGTVKIPGAAVSSYITNTMNAKLSVAASSMNTGNRFWNCHRAVMGSNVYLVHVENSLFRSTQSSTASGVQPGNLGINLSSNRFDHYIRDNEFTNINNPVNESVSTGTYMVPGGTLTPNGIYARRIRVSYNSFSSGTLTNAYMNNAITINGPLNVGYNVPSESVTPFTLGISIDHNVISNVYRGIYINGNAPQFPSTIYDNTVSLVSDPNASLQFGINVTGTQGKNFVSTNSLSANSTTNTNQSLLYFTNNMGILSPSISCNTATNCNKGFEFVGANGTPTAPLISLWRGNKMQSLVRGMQLTNGGVIGPQGSSLSPIDNQWVGSWSGNNGAFSFNANALFSSLSVKSYTPFTVPSPAGTGTAISQFYGALNTIYTSSFGDYHCGDFPSSRTVTNSLVFESTTHLFSYKDALYRYLYFNDSIRGVVSGLSVFYEAHKDSSFGSYVDIETNLLNGDYSAAGTLIAGLSPINDAETAYQSFYSLYKKYAQNKFEYTDADDSSGLNDLANSCIDIYGPAVLRARALYNLVFKNVFAFSGSCEGERAQSFTGQQISNATFFSNTNWDIQHYPNPAEDEITIVTPQESEEFTLQIRDLAGRTYFTETLKSKNYLVNLNINLYNGVYIVRATNKMSEISNFKLIVNK